MTLRRPDPAVREIAALLADVKRLKRATQVPQLVHSSIDAGHVKERDDLGNDVGIIGQNPLDGGHGYTTLVSPVPPVPVGPDCEGGPGFIRVGVSGGFVDALVAPSFLTAFEVHVGLTAVFVPDVTPSSATRRGEVGSAGGGEVVVAAAAGVWFVRLVSRSNAGSFSAPSTATQVTVAPVADQAQVDTMQGRLDFLLGATPVSYGTEPVEPRQGYLWFDGPLPDGPFISKAWDAALPGWRATTLADGAIAGLAIGKLLAGQLTVAMDITAGGVIRAANPTTGDEARMSGTSGFEYYIPHQLGDGSTAAELVRVFRAGRGYDVVNPADPTETLASVTGGGDYTGKAAAFNSVAIGGEDVAGKLSSVAQGMVVNERIISTQGPYGTAYTGYYEFAFDVVGGRAYLMVVDQEYTALNSSAQLRVYKTQATPGGNPAAPLVTDTPFLTVSVPPSTRETNAHYSFRFVPTDSESTKWLIGGRAATSGGQITFLRATVMVYDMGPFTGIDTTGRLSLGGAGGTTPDPSPTVKKYTGTYQMDWDQSYNQSGKLETTRLYHGTQVGSTAQWEAALRMPDAARSLMLGATKVNAYLRLHNSGPHASGTAKVGRHTVSATTAPTSAPAVVGEHSVAFNKGEIKEFLLPDAWTAGYVAGTYYGFTLGNINTRPEFMYFSRRTADPTVRPQLRLEVWK